MSSYFICLPGSREPRSWNPLDHADRPIADCNYFGTVFSHFEQSGGSTHWKFYVTWNVDWLPELGPDVVAVLLGDEWCRTPRYASEVAAVFKCYGTARKFWSTPAFDALWLLALIQSLRIETERLPYRIGAVKMRLKSRKACVFDVPLGYYKQLDLPIVPIDRRRYDVFFAGSLTQESSHRPFPLSLFRQPKTLAREQMLAVLFAYRERHPERALELRTTASFEVSAVADDTVYSSALQQTKVCVVPRGTSLETFRWFEGLRYGCVVICEELPKRRYYDGAPVIVLDRWAALPATLDRVLGDPAVAERYHRDALRWWSDRCSEAATSTFIREKLNALSAR